VPISSLGSDEKYPILVTACDAGSANFLLPLIGKWKGPICIKTQGIATDIFRKNGQNTIDYPINDNVDQLELLGNNLIGDDKFSAVLTGTSWGATIDKAATLAARKFKLPHAAIIDHWALYRERFSLVKDGCIIKPDIYLPREIWLPDKLALDDGIKAGLPPNILRIVGQPHLEKQKIFLNSAKPLPLSNKLVFISERIGEDFIIGSPLYPGFNEIDIVETIISSASKADISVLIKLHPQEEKSKFDLLLSKTNNATVVQNVDIPGMIKGAGWFVGMMSMLLLEAALIRNDVISFMPGDSQNQFIGNRIGAVTSLSTANELDDLFKNASRKQNKKDSGFNKRFLGSTDSCLNNIERLISCA
jgi:hypothetical protein